MKSKNANQGFTLLEVMLAVAVFAAAASILLMAGSGSLQKVQLLEEKTLAVQVAENYLSELRWTKKKQSGNTEKKITFADREWSVKSTTKKTDNKGILRVEISVERQLSWREDEPYQLATLVAFMEADAS
ncbi:type II secretion system minor pseudopilin GspI [Zooshikella harenae]|uniref:Type II secretion system protein I n=1 Tax=Zooshikella harenae TaxID=2827238 RepID=A0ABS5ZDX9_9GAMM|nr:type II secretion system minor pseudopilin GspI [Zooshikella harenae]MBU2712199.1 type II secretion system minor pseudopilin GspI [Zooshikella harenae]